MNKIYKIEQYIHEFFSTRYSDYCMFYEDEYTHRRTGIYQLKRGNEIMDFLNTIIGNIKEELYVEKLVPQVFATPKHLLKFIKNFRDYLDTHQDLLDENLTGDPYSVIHEIQRIKTELVDLLDHLILIYDLEDTRIPYQELRHALIIKNYDEFFTILNSILASVSYAILKQKEGYLHSNIHLILKMLGFNIESEETTNIGRIDAVIRFSNAIYIMEFKNGTSDEALNQIEEKKYHEKYVVERKPIIAIGVGFDNKKRNISDYKTKEY